MPKIRSQLVFVQVIMSQAMEKATKSCVLPVRKGGFVLSRVVCIVISGIVSLAALVFIVVGSPRCPRQFSFLLYYSLQCNSTQPCIV